MIILKGAVISFDSENSGRSNFNSHTLLVVIVPAAFSQILSFFNIFSLYFDTNLLLTIHPLALESSSAHRNLTLQVFFFFFVRLLVLGMRTTTSSGEFPIFFWNIVYQLITP